MVVRVALAVAAVATEKSLSSSNPDDDPEWIRYFDLAELNAEFAHCFRDLDRPDLATEHAAKSIEVSESFYVRSLSFCRTLLATSYLQANEVEQAVTTAREVVDTAAGLKSYRVNSYLDEFRQRLRQHSDSPAVADFESYASTQE